MKKRLAVLCGVYYPEPSPTGLCAKKFVELLKEDFDIDILCISENGAAETICSEEGIVIHTLTCRRLAQQTRAAGVEKKALHLLGAAQIKLRLLGNLSWLRKAYNNKLCELNAEHPFDTVFSICSPFAAHVAACDYKASHKNVHWCAYTVDPYATENRIRPIGVSLSRLCAIERETLLKTDSLLLSEEVYRHREALYAGHPDCQPLPYLLPEIHMERTGRKFFDENDINCVYAGSFYRDIRNPEHMLQLFSRLDDPRIKLHLFSRGCEDLVKKYADESSCIIVHERVPVSEMAQVYSEADVLINAGNATMEFLPSKTFEYISSCKPIVNIYYPGLRDEVLDQHPMCLQLCNSDQVQQAVPQLQNFIRKNGQETVSMDVIRTRYSKHLPENIKNILKSSTKGGKIY